MEPERAAIIVWCLRSVAKVLEAGEFTLPKSSEDVFSQWKEETNPVADFIASCAEMSESYEKFAYVYDEFKDWAMSAGRRSMSKIAFGRRLKECEIKMRRESTGKAVALRMKPRTEWLDFTHH
jgi:phage/plasmid-associated DNA primase